VVEDLNKIEDFVDRIGDKCKIKNPFVTESKDTQIPKELIKLKRMKNKFIKLMDGPPYDTFFDEE